MLAKAHPVRATFLVILAAFFGACGAPSEETRQEAVSDTSQTVAASPACYPPPDGLVAWWPGDGNANDIVGHVVGIKNGVSFSSGMVGQAFSLNGSFVSAPDTGAYLSFGVNSPITVDAWVFRTSSSLPQHILGKRLAGCSAIPFNYQLAIDQNGLGFGGDSPPGTYWSSGVDVPLNTWTHVAATFDGSSYRIYINGNLVSTSPSGLSLGPTNAVGLKIGTSGDCAPFAGQIDEADVFRRALTAAEIQAIYAAGSTGKCKGLRLPWTAGESWKITSGPHGKLGEGMLKAIDFAPGISCPGDASQAWVRAAAAGIVFTDKAAIGLQHPDGTSTIYCHVSNDLKLNPGVAVERGQRLGHPSCKACAGETVDADARHVHFYRRITATNQLLPADGMMISGWTIHQEDPCRQQKGPGGKRIECAASLTKPNEADRKICPTNGAVVPGTDVPCSSGPTDLTSDNTPDNSP